MNSIGEIGIINSLFGEDETKQELSPAIQDFMDIFCQYSHLAYAIRRDKSFGGVMDSLDNDIDIIEEMVNIAKGVQEDMGKVIKGVEIMLLLLEKAGENTSQYRQEFNRINNDFQQFEIGEFIWFMEDTLRGFMASREGRREIKRVAKKYNAKLFGFEKGLQAFVTRLDNHFENKEKEKGKEQKRQEKKLKQEQRQEQLLRHENNYSGKTDEKIPTWLLDKVGTLQKRVENILGDIEKEGKNPYKKELEKISQELTKLQQKTHFPEVHIQIKNIFELITTIHTTKINIEKNLESAQGDKIEATTQDEGEEKIKISPRNQEIIEIFKKILKNFDHTISSTKNTTTSYGDGSFVVKFFRPFIYGLINEIFSKNKIILNESFSWKEIIDVYEEQIENKDRAQTHLYGLLKNSKQKYSTFKDLFNELYDVVEEFSLSERYHIDKGNSLKDFLKKFREFIDEEF